MCLQIILPLQLILEMPSGKTNRKLLAVLIENLSKNDPPKYSLDNFSGANMVIAIETKKPRFYK